MFNLNESNRFVMSRNPIDLRKGVDSLCGSIRSCRLDPLNGDVYVLSNCCCFLPKLFHWICGGYTLCYKLLLTGCFYPVIFFIHPKSIAFSPFLRLPTFGFKTPYSTSMNATIF